MINYFISNSALFSHNEDPISLGLHSLVCLGWIVDCVPFLIFLLNCMCIYCVTINDFEFWTFELWTSVPFDLERCNNCKGTPCDSLCGITHDSCSKFPPAMLDRIALWNPTESLKGKPWDWYQIYRVPFVHQVGRLLVIPHQSIVHVECDGSNQHVCYSDESIDQITSFYKIV